MRLLRSALLLTLLAHGGLCFAAAPRVISLDGIWNFIPDPSGAIPIEGLKTILNPRLSPVPSSWQTVFEDLRDYAGVGWYWRTVKLDALQPDEVALLRFGAVDYRAEVFVNGRKAGAHDGGYLPFEFNVTALVREGENQVAVRVADPGANPDTVEGIVYAEIPHGKQNWYVQTSGLWQSVTVEIRPALRFGAVQVSAQADGKFAFSAAIIPSARALAAPVDVSAEIRDRDGKSVWQGSRAIHPGGTRADFSGQVAAPYLWNLAAPQLYTLEVRLPSGDSRTTHFGFRTFESRGGKFYLNGRVVYLRGALDQDFYPDTFYTPPSLDAIRDEMRKAKALGLNLLRCHIKVPDPRYLEAADETGMLIWYEIPNWDKLTPASQASALEILRGMAERDWNHPSLVLVSILNESWGANLKETADRAWLKSAYEQAKKIVPWLVDDNSACCDNFHVETDLADYHQYNAIPDFAGDFDRYIDDFARRPGWLFSPYGDAAPKGTEPLVLSEFGNWGLPHPPEPRPWWFSRPFGNNPLTLPEGVEKRFAAYQLETLFKDYDELANETEQHQFAALEYEISSLRSHPEIQGYVITEFTDINWESNGLMDMWRHPKAFAPELARLQRDDVVLARADRRNFQAGERASATVFFSHYSGLPVTGGVVRWALEGTPLVGSFPLPAMDAGSTVTVGKVDIVVPDVAKPSSHLLKLRVEAGGDTLAENVSDPLFYFYPAATPTFPPAVSFRDPAGRLRRLVNAMHERNYQEPSGREALPVLITSVFDNEVKRALQAGGHVILLASDPATLAPGLEIVPRSKDELSGNWISSFLWVRKASAPFRSLGFGPLAGFEAQEATPEAVIEGVPPEEFGDVLSGIFYGWIQASRATVVQAQAGNGRLLICTFSLATTYGTDPYATALLDAMVNLVVSNFTPHYRIPI